VPDGIIGRPIAYTPVNNKNITAKEITENFCTNQREWFGALIAGSLGDFSSMIRETSLLSG